MLTLAALSWGLAFGLLVVIAGLCIISTIEGRPHE